MNQNDEERPTNVALVPGNRDSVSVEALRRYQPVHPTSNNPVRKDDDAELARGGMGRILCVFDRHTSRQIVLKERLHSDQLVNSPRDADQLSAADARFLHEARVTAQLEHPNIVPVYEIGQRPSGSFYYTMQKVRGKTLARHLRECETLVERMEYLPHFLNVCNAIAYAHSKGIIHRDLKPDNIMIGPFGDTIVLDWGIAKVIGAPESESDRQLIQLLGDMKGESAKTLDGYAVGTPSYLSPEAANGEISKINQRSDVYALGAVLYEIIAARPAHKGKSPMDTIAIVLTQEPEALHSIEKKVPRELEEIVNTAMSRDADDRHHDAGELASQLERFLAGKFVPPPKGGTIAWFKYVWREKRGPLLGLLFILLLLGLGVLLHMREIQKAAGVIAALESQIAETDALNRQMLHDKKQLVGTVLAGQADADASTSRGLLLAAHALTLNNSSINKSLLYREATARPYGLAVLGMNVPGSCRFVEGRTRDGDLPACVTPRGKLLFIEPEKGEIASTVSLSYKPRASRRTSSAKILLGDDKGVLHFLDNMGSETAKVAMPGASSIHYISDTATGNGNHVAVGSDDSRVFLVDEIGQKVIGSIALPSGKAPFFSMLRNADSGRGLPLSLVADRNTLYDADFSQNKMETLAKICPVADRETAEGLSAMSATIVGSETLTAHACGDERLVIGDVTDTGWEPVDVVELKGELVSDVIIRTNDTHSPEIIAVTNSGGLHLVRRTPGKKQWTVDSILAHDVAVQSVIGARNRLLTADANGLVKIWNDPPAALGSRMREWIPLPGQVRDFDGLGQALVQLENAIELVQVRTGSTVKIDVPGLLTSRLTNDGWSVLALALDGDILNVLKIDVGNVDKIKRWRSPLEDASKIWPLDRPGVGLAVLSNSEGVFHIVDIDNHRPVGERRSWGTGPMVEVLSDPYNSKLTILSETGALAIGGLRAKQPIWTWKAGKLSQIAITTDGKWLVMIGSHGSIWSTSFAAPETMFESCTPGERQRVSRDEDTPASCFALAGLKDVKMTVSVDARRVMIVDAEKLVVYDLYKGKTDFSFPLGKVDSARTNGRAETILLARKTNDTKRYTAIPTATWIFDDPGSLMRIISKATGLKVEGDEIIPLKRDDWVLLGKSPPE